MYLCAHCCSNVASRAQVRPIIKLKNQSAFTQTAWFGGENGVGKPGGNSKYWIDSGRRRSDKYLRNRSWRCPVGLVECPEWTLRSTTRQLRRINRSTGDEST